MASPSLPQRTLSSSAAEHVADHNAAHPIVAEFDTTITSATTGQTLVHDGTNFKPGTVSGSVDARTQALAQLLADGNIQIALIIPITMTSHPTTPAALTGDVQWIIKGGTEPPTWGQAGDLQLATA